MESLEAQASGSSQSRSLKTSSRSTKDLGTTNLLLRASSEALQQRSKTAGTLGTTTPCWWNRFRWIAVATNEPPITEQIARIYVSFIRIHPINADSQCTDTLPKFHATVDLLKQEHINAARASIRDPEILLELQEEIDRDCERLRSYLFAAKNIDEGIDAEYVSLDDIVPPFDDNGETTLTQGFYDSLAVTLGEHIKQCGSRVPVVTEFFGIQSVFKHQGSRFGKRSTEYSPQTRKVPTARLIPVISSEEAAELTCYGSEVVPPFTMEQAIRGKIPIRIKNVENPGGGGTVIHPDADPEPASPKLSSLVERTWLPTAVTIKEHIIVLNVISNRKSVSHGFLPGIFGTLDRFGVVVDLISTSEVHVSMAIEDGPAKKFLDRLIKELKKSGTVSLSSDCRYTLTLKTPHTGLSLVGRQMRNMVGIAGKMFYLLALDNINIEMITQGATDINISCVIEGKDAMKALSLIHQRCLQVEAEGPRGRVGLWLS
ncbi:hypothetical protein K443DRAFT_120803 [Laccaria amethystina LaAM-08-1]|uniref:aspartate kinase n=1 Tax=Laccaria amethystina LaAM-08-1 TaxID=1095629 RepID=A0A0C9XIG8_9AGAR|nr:hypothetical protein K443DRAFT_120803 [Laccaria amethystina LaAM-08-1]